MWVEEERQGMSASEVTVQSSRIYFAVFLSGRVLAEQDMVPLKNSPFIRRQTQKENYTIVRTEQWQSST